MYEENVLSYGISRDYLFYTTADLQVYRMRHDGTEKTAIYELRNPMSLCVSENKLYAHWDEEVISMDFDGKNPKVVCNGKAPIVLNGYLFYMDNGVIRVADI